MMARRSRAAVLGLGLTQVPQDFVEDEIARGELVEVLPGARPAPMPISIVNPAARLVPQRVRVLIDALQSLQP
jgi:DNA-binding transcriptional LysR family regulator